MLIRRILRDDSWKVLAYTAILAVNALATVLAWPTFEANYEVVMKLVPGFLTHLKDAIAGAGRGGIEGFVAVNHLFKGANVIAAAAAVLLAAGSIAREVEIGTIGMLLSRPLRRSRVLLTFALVQLAEVLVPLVVVTVAIPATAQALLGEEVQLEPLLLGALHACAFLSLVHAIALLVAVLASAQLVVAGVAGGLCVASFVLYFVDATRPFTLYRFSSLEEYARLASGGALDLALVSGLLLATVAVVALALRVFARRDY